MKHRRKLIREIKDVGPTDEYRDRVKIQVWFEPRDVDEDPEFGYEVPAHVSIIVLRPVPRMQADRKRIGRNVRRPRWERTELVELSSDALVELMDACIEAREYVRTHS